MIAPNKKINFSRILGGQKRAMINNVNNEAANGPLL
jgi:hypothetical protein